MRGLTVIVYKNLVVGLNRYRMNNGLFQLITVMTSFVNAALIYEGNIHQVVVENPQIQSTMFLGRILIVLFYMLFFNWHCFCLALK